MHTVGRSARRGVAAVLAVTAASLACGEPRTGGDAAERWGPPRPTLDAALARDLQLAAAAGVEFAVPHAPVSPGRFLGAAERPAAAPRDGEATAEPTRRVARRTRTTSPAHVASAAPTPAAAPSVVETPSPAPTPAPEPEPERLLRYAHGDALEDAYAVGVVLRGGRVGDDDKCDAVLPRPRSPSATVIRSAPQVTLRDARAVGPAGRPGGFGAPLGAPVGGPLPPF